MQTVKVGIYRRYVKRPMDIATALLAIIVLLPLLFMVAVLVRRKIGSSILFKQNRPGLNEKIFTLYKFRTMTDKRDENGTLLPDHDRLVKFGRFLRSTSIDELPELINILKGDMSIVGPRPLLEQYLPLYNKYQKRRHEVRPGLSGLAQANGRNDISWEDKFKLDLKYVDKITFVGDLKIILLTIKKVFEREGINSKTSTTMEFFHGNKERSEVMYDKNQLLIIGASGHGKVVADIALIMNRWKQISFLDDDKPLKTSVGIEIIGKSSDFFLYVNDYDIFVAIGNNVTRERILNELEIAGATIPILIHPNSVIGSQVDIGVGTVIMAGAVINCCSKIGKGCIINTSASIDHDNVIGDYVHISPGTHIAGMVMIGKNTWLGIGSTVSNNINITGNCILGAGTVVVKDITESGTYVGVPARCI